MLFISVRNDVLRFETYDYLTWRNVHNGSQFATHELLDAVFNISAVEISLSTAHAIARLIQPPDTKLIWYDEKWQHDHATAIYSSHEKYIAVSFGKCYMTVYGTVFSYSEYKSCARHIITQPTPTLDRLIGELITLRDGLRKARPNVSEFNIDGSAYRSVLQQIRGETYMNLNSYRCRDREMLNWVINDILPLPIAEEVSAEI